MSLADDSELLRRLRARDEKAFAELIDSLSGRLLRLAMVFVGDRDAATEVVQETWLAVLSGLAAFEGRSSLNGWIFSILANRARTRGTRDKRSVRFSELETDDTAPSVVPATRFSEGGHWAEPPSAWAAESPETIISRRETMVALEAALNELPPQQRAVVVLKDIDGLEPDEICNVLGVSETNQRVLLHRGRARLRLALEQHLRKA